MLFAQTYTKVDAGAKQDHLLGSPSGERRASLATPMPDQERMVEHSCTAAGWAAMGSAAGVLGGTTLDICLNDCAYWRNVPAVVCGYRLCGYQVLTKWLSYRERGVSGRGLRVESQHVVY